uniref:Uncharacterized protein n=1 Tax=virus sp. ct9pU4 TaxID=2828248 RepID=A0A8S5RAQ3_9VIRU|nr:MAG TPA: hypothetical protein [virus sp. ct9pU4]
MLTNRQPKHTNKRLYGGKGEYCYRLYILSK